MLIFFYIKLLYYNYIGGGKDYISGPYAVTIPAGHDIVKFNVSIIADNIIEPSEIFFLAIDTSTLPNMVSAGNPHQVTVSIVEDVGEQTNVFVTRNIQVLQYHFTILVCSICKSLASIITCLNIHM